MFGTTKNYETVRDDRIDTIIGTDAIIEGMIKTTGTVRIDGKVKGTANADGMLIIGKMGKFEGDIVAESMLVAGSVTGDITVNEKLEITETGEIIGDIVTKSLVIAEGASFEGKSVMNLNKNAEQTKKADTKEKMENVDKKGNEGKRGEDKRKNTEYQ